MRRCLFELLKSDLNLIYLSFQKTNFAARRVALAHIRALGVLQDTANGPQGLSVWLAIQTDLQDRGRYIPIIPGTHLECGSSL